MNVPQDRRYTSEHEWVLVVEGGVRMGITDYAQHELGDVVYVDLPEVGQTVDKGAAIVEVESTKSVADVYAPMAGTINAVNESLADEPEQVNRDPYGAGWFVEIAGEADLDGLVDANGYRALTE